MPEGTNKEKTKFWLEALKLLAHVKHAGLGIVVILSFIGAIYGSFKPEQEAREGFSTLKPYIETNENQILNMQLDIAYLKGRLANTSCPTTPPNTTAKIAPPAKPKNEKKAPAKPLPSRNRKLKRNRSKIRAPWEQNIPAS